MSDITITIPALTLLKSKSDWERVKDAVNLKYNYSHWFDNEPESYPCYLELGERIDIQDQPYTFEPVFFYKNNHTCDHCGANHSDYPPIVAERLDQEPASR